MEEQSRNLISGNIQVKGTIILNMSTQTPKDNYFMFSIWMLDNKGYICVSQFV